MLKNENYFDHDADIGIIGRGDSMEECFISAAKSLFELMADLSDVHPKQSISFEFKETDPEFALVTWLNHLIAKADAEHLILSKFHLIRKGNIWMGSAMGDVWHKGIERGIDVKGATLTMLSVKQKDGKWEAQCVVDV